VAASAVHRRTRAGWFRWRPGDPRLRLGRPSTEAAADTTTQSGDSQSSQPKGRQRGGVNLPCVGVRVFQDAATTDRRVAMDDDLLALPGRVFYAALTYVSASLDRNPHCQPVRSRHAVFPRIGLAQVCWEQASDTR
jgi:hypothetical protein